MIKNNRKFTINNWLDIPWDSVNSKVRDLQNRFVEAILANDIKLVYKLQNQLVVSFEGRALAIRRVLTSSDLPY